MSVYKEGFAAIKEIEKNYVQIWDDACDVGALVKKDDSLWNWTKQLVEWYGDKSTRKVDEYPITKSVEQIITLIDEWAVSDERKSMKEATEKYKVFFYTDKRGLKKDGITYDGYVYIEKIK